MDLTMIGIICIALLLLLIFLSVPVGIAFIISGVISTILIFDIERAISLLMGAAFSSIAAPSWTAIPLFILLGALAVQADLARRAFKSADAITSGMPGSVGITTCFACAGFGAISGASIAATSIFGKMALPEMRRLGYGKEFASGLIASAGTFASMIPPSMMFIIYALFTNTSIAELFFAGIIPGILTAVVYAIFIYVKSKRDKVLVERQKAEPKLNGKERLSALFSAWPIVLVAIVILGGIYTGLFTPTEAAAAGCVLILAVGIFEGRFRKLSDVNGALRESANTTSMVFLINIGALFYAKVLVLSRLPQDFTVYLTNLDVPPFVIVLIICLVFFLLGMIMVPIGIYAMILPIVIPIITSLGYDPIWFGVIALKLTEIGAVTPPVGLNVYALKGVVTKDISVVDIFKGIWPFVILDVIILSFLIAFPQITLWVPNLLFD
ncbi:TRAP transporter large permease [Virgibacillus byunsanensis]|uniref:TRAP transporter large permease n=1 Tax=Virgibacillus byunsanensis TaxID=570945 RepID=A0ABW3LMM4_9BACI